MLLSLPLPSFLKKAQKWFSTLVLGDDIFISYARADGSDYATALGDRLTQDSYIVYLDQIKAYPDSKVSKEVLTKLARSATLVLIGTREAAHSRNVAKELRVFFRTGRPVITINVDHELENAAWYHRLIRGMAISHVKSPKPDPKPNFIPEQRTPLSAGLPSEEVIRRVKASFGYIRRRMWARNIFLGTLLMILIMGGIAGWAGWKVITVQAETDRQVKEAQTRVDDANKEANARIERINIDANARIEQINKEVGEQLKEAAKRIEDAQAAEKTARDNTAKQEKIAAAQTKRAATEALKVQGSTATLLSRQAGQEIAALKAAVTAVDADPGNLLTEVKAGLHDALLNANYSLPLPTIAKINPDRTGDFSAASVVSLNTKDTNAWLVTTSIGKNPNERATVQLWDNCMNSRVVDLGLKGRGLEFVAFSPDGSHIVTSNQFGVYTSPTLRVASPITLKNLRGDGIKVSFSGDGKRLLTFSNGEARLWSAETGLPIGSEFKVPGLKFARFSPDRVGKFILTANDNELQKWDGVNGTTDAKPIARFSPVTDKETEINCGTGTPTPGTKPEVSFITAIAISHDGKYVAAGYIDGYIREWSEDKPSEVKGLARHFCGNNPEAGRGFRGDVRGIEFAPAGDRFVTWSTDQSAMLFDSDTMLMMGRLLHRGLINHVSFSRAGGQLVTTANDGMARVWETRIGTLTAILAVDQSPNERSVRYAAFIPHPSTPAIITVSGPGAARIWNGSTTWYAYGTGERLSIPATDEEVLFFWGTCTKGDDDTFTDLTFEQKLVAARCLLSKYPGQEQYAGSCSSVPGPRNHSTANTKIWR